MRRLALALLLVTGAVVRPLGAQGYEIGPGDVVQVTVLGQPGFSGDFTVGADGVLAYPFLGKVKASGMSAAELEKKLVTLLSDGYLRRPQIAVAVKQFKSQRVYVTGEIVRPGPYGLRPERSLSMLLQDIGELTPNTGHEVIVIRAPAADWNPQPPPESPAPVVPGTGEAASEGASPATSPSPTPTPRPGPLLPGEVPGSEIFRVNLRELRAGFPGRDMTLKVGDTVYFPKAALVYVTGHVARPGAFRFEEGLTVFQALALAGSVTERGSEKRLRIVRLVEGRRKEIKPGLSDPVQPEDTLHVPERFF